MKFFVPITETVQLIPLLFATCCDYGIFKVAMFNPQDSAPIYGTQAEVFDGNGRSLYYSRIYESYDPPTAEMIPVLLPRGAAYVRCEIFGPDLVGKWTDASFEIVFQTPNLEIRVLDGAAVLSWDDPCGCWGLERLTDGWWFPSERVVPITDRSAFFRLRRL